MFVLEFDVTEFWQSKHTINSKGMRMLMPYWVSIPLA